MHTVRLTGRREIAQGTMEFSFARPEGFNYEAGQTVDLTLIKPSETDAEGPTRTFSLVSAPHEGALKVAMRMRDTAFKRVLKGLAEAAELSLEGPFGSFLLHENAARPAIFLAGGIGITPFRSMIHDALARALPHSLTLFYSNRRPEEAAYLDELDALAQGHPSFTFVPTLSGAGVPPATWSGEQGRIDAPMLARHAPPGAAPVYYLAGPPAMVSAMRAVLKEAGVSADDIRFEEFSGY